jgi:hypothetical protein
MIGPHRAPTREHVLPRSRWKDVAEPIDHVRNCITVCRPCNVDKADRTLAEFLDVLLATRDGRAVYVARFLIGMIDRGLAHLCGAERHRGPTCPP